MKVGKFVRHDGAWVVEVEGSPGIKVNVPTRTGKDRFVYLARPVGLNLWRFTSERQFITTVINHNEDRE